MKIVVLFIYFVRHMCDFINSLCIDIHSLYALCQAEARSLLFMSM